MDKRLKMGNQLPVLKIKTGIDLYRSISILIFGLSLICCISFAIMGYTKNAVPIIISLLFSFVFLLLAIFMEKLVYLFNLPTNYLLIFKDKIIYKKSKKQITFILSETKYEFHSFFEDFESLSQLKLTSNDEECFILITKKQFKAMKQFLQET